MKLLALLLLISAVPPAATAIALEAGSDPSTSAPQDNAPTAKAPLLPNWFSFRGQFRGRFEGQSGIGFEPGNNDADFLSRLRLDLAIKPLPWLQMYMQGQDSRAAGYNNRTASVQDPLELRLAYLEVGNKEQGGVVARVGRQELSYGGGRLVSAAEWGNTARTFEGATVSLYRWQMKLDLLTASVIQPDMSRFDRHKPGERITGAYLTMSKLLPGTSIEPYLFYRTQLNVVGERGDHGQSDLYVGGVHIKGNAPGRLDYQVLITREWGTYASDRMLAYGGTYIAGWTVSHSTIKPRISAEFTQASGDGNNRDGQRGTFDQIYGSYHFFLGAADRLGWRNSRNARLGFDFSPSKKLRVFADLRNLSLATVKDGMYAANGSRSVLNTKATSTHVGEEIDCYVVYQWSKHTTVGAGIGHLLPGEYLRQSTKGSGYTYPYLMVARTF